MLKLGHCNFTSDRFYLQVQNVRIETQIILFIRHTVGVPIILKSNCALLNVSNKMNTSTFKHSFNVIISFTYATKID